MSALSYVGAAYAIVWLLLLVYALRMTATARRLADKVERLEKAFETTRTGR
jgi:CcmD family protein